MKIMTQIGNISTIIKYISMFIAGLTISTLAQHGLNIPIDEQGLGEAIGAIIFLLLAHIDATNPNTIFNNENKYSCNTETKDYTIQDVDPATEYEENINNTDDDVVVGEENAG